MDERKHDCWWTNCKMLPGTNDDSNCCHVQFAGAQESHEAKPFTVRGYNRHSTEAKNVKNTSLEFGIFKQIEKLSINPILVV
jgi:hypothetical protein